MQKESKDDFFCRLGKFEDDAFRTDYERISEFCQRGIKKFLNAVVYPYKLEDKRGFFKRLFCSPVRIYQIPKKDALERMVKSGFTENNKSAENILEGLTKASYPAFYDSMEGLKYIVNLRSNSKRDKLYEFEGIVPAPPGGIID